MLKLIQFRMDKKLNSVFYGQKTFVFLIIQLLFKRSDFGLA